MIGALASNNKAILEKILMKKLSLIAKAVGLNLPEWDIDKSLYLAIRKSNKLTSAAITCIEYSAIIEAATLMKLKINPNFYWFNNLEQFNNTKNK